MKTLEHSTITGSFAPDCDVVIVGAGPYGLSATSHLKSAGLRVLTFGKPMEFWATKMPSGMLLRSPREASTIADPKSAWTLENYEAATGRKPSAPVPLDAFVDYGCWFREKLGTCVNSTSVAKISLREPGFAVTLGDGQTVITERVVVAAGIAPFRRKPEVFQGLPEELASHCYEGKSIRSFAGKKVAVIGAGQSALESAALLSEAGSSVEIIAAGERVRWIGQHPWLHNLGPISQMLYSKYDVGPAGISRLVSWPKIMSHVPLTLKDRIRKRAVRPAGSKWLPERLRSVTMTTGRVVKGARELNGAVEISLDDGTHRSVDHVLMGTGYDVEISKYDFLDSGLLSRVRRLGGYPDLGPGFRSSVRGLHFIGGTAARNFGPLMYFVAGTEFASRELTSHIAR